MLHVVDYITRYGFPMNYDGSRGESFGNLKIKDNAKLTNKQKDTLNFDIGRRNSEEDIVDEISTVYYQNVGDWPSTYCNKADIMLNANKIQTNKINGETSVPRARIKPRFKLIIQIDNSDIDDITAVVEIHVEWGGQSRTPLLNYPREILLKIASRLYIGYPYISGKISQDSVVNGYTEIEKDSNLYRSHPWFHKKGCWYDWAYFQ